MTHTNQPNPYLDPDLLDNIAATIDPHAIAGVILEAMMHYAIAPHSQNGTLLWVHTFDDLRDSIETHAKHLPARTHHRAVILETPEAKQTAQEIAHRALFPDDPLDDPAAETDHQLPQKGETKR